MIALPTGDRVSELAAMSRAPAFLSFSENYSSVNLAPTPSFIAKNERWNHVFTPITIPALILNGVNHSLCPVNALKLFLQSSNPKDPTALWVNPSSGRRLSTRAISSKLVDVVKSACPDVKVRAHDIRKWAATVLFLQNFSLQDVNRAGLWASPHVFVERYLCNSVSPISDSVVAVRRSTSV